jgi:hypothetical protein
MTEGEGLGDQRRIKRILSPQGIHTSVLPVSIHRSAKSGTPRQVRVPVMISQNETGAIDALSRGFLRAAFEAGDTRTVIAVDDQPGDDGEYWHTVRTAHWERREPGSNWELITAPRTETRGR